MNFADRLAEAIAKKRSRVVVGLDPRLENLPEDLRRRARVDIENAAQAVLEWGGDVIEAVKDHAVAVKPQIAFYERMGPFGVVTYFALCKHARKQGLLVIGDVKRGDVPDTAKAYAEAHLGAFDCDAITVNPYLGGDAMAPFVEQARKTDGGLFVLVKTSNPGSGDLQDLRVDGRPLYLHVAEKVAGWGKELIGTCGYSSIGAVVGATHRDQAAELRKAVPAVPFLVPGYGAQGAGAEDIRACFDAKGLGAVVNASRSVIYAHEKEPYASRFKPADWAKAAGAAAAAMKDEINRALGL
jgi:orotidine-5'-phosphate decarboxylase